MKNIIERTFALKAPCENCPFRKVGAIQLQPGRLEGIVETLTADDMSTFHCHKTVHSQLGGEWVDDEDGGTRYVASNKEAMCAGAIIYLEKIRQPTVGMRLGRALGVYDPATLRPSYDDILDPIDGPTRT